MLAAPAGVGGGGGGAPARFIPFITAPNVPQSDLPALARAQVREIQREAQAMASTAVGATAKAHWADVADRASRVLQPKG